MATITASDKLNIRICHILKLEPRHVKRIVIEFKAGDCATVTIDRKLKINEELEIYREVAEHYTITPKGKGIYLDVSPEGLTVGAEMREGKIRARAKGKQVI